MNLTWHIARNDIVRLRLQLIPWLGIVVLQVVLNWRLLSPISLDYVEFDRLSMFANLAGALGLLLTFFLAAAVILEDPLSDPAAFWVTRPISGARLLRAKGVTTVLLLVLPPVVLWLPWWLYCGYQFSDLAHESLRTMAWQLAAVFPAYVLASQTGRVGRLALVSAAVAVAILVVLLVAFAYQFPRGISADVLSSRLLLALIAILLFGSASVWRRYVSTGADRSSAILVAGLLVAAAIMAASPWNLVANWRERQWHAGDNQGMTARIVSATDAKRTDEADRAKFLIDIQISLSGVPDALAVAAGRADIELRWPDGKVLQQRQQPVWVKHGDDNLPVRLALGLPRDDPWQNSWDPGTDRWLAEQKPTDERSRLRLLTDELHAHGNSMHRLRGSERFSNVWTTLEVDRLDMQRIASEAPAWRVTIHGLLAQPVPILDQPLVAGSSESGAGIRSFVAGLSSASVQKPYHLKFASGGVLMGTPTSTGDVDFCWVERERGLAWNLGVPWRMNLVPFSTRIGVLNFNRWTPQLRRDGGWIDEDETGQHPRLVALAYRPEKRFECVAEIPRLALGAKDEP